jgi:hypothetical protein
MMNEQLLMFKLNQITLATKASFVVLQNLTQKMLKWIIFQLKDANNVNRKQNLSMQTCPPWIISNHDIFIAFFFQLHLLDSDVQF